MRTFLSNKILFLLMSFILSACDSGGNNNSKPVETLPAPPNEIVVTAGDSETILTWAASTEASSYTVYYSDTAEVTTSDISQTTTDTSLTITGLLNNTHYYFAVSASSSSGESALSLEVSATPFLSAPSMAYLVGTAGISTTSISAEWLVSSDAETAPANLNYAVHLSGTDNFQPSVSSLTSASAMGVTSLTVDGLLANTTYYVMIVTTDESGNESWSNILPTSTLSLDPLRTAATVYVQDSSNIPTVNGSQITYQDATNTPEVGEIIVSGEGDGYLRKVLSVSKTADTVTVETEQAHLNEVFSELEISTTIKTVPLAGSITSFSKSLGKNVMTANWPDSGLRFEQVNSNSQIKPINNFRSNLKVGSGAKANTPVLAPDEVKISETFKTNYPRAVSIEPGETTSIEIHTEITADQSFIFSPDVALRVCQIELNFYYDQNNVRSNTSSLFNVLAMNRTSDPQTGFVSVLLRPDDSHVSTQGKPHRFRFKITPGKIDDNCGTVYAAHFVEIPVYVTKGEDLPRMEEKTVTFSGGFNVESALTLDFNPELEVKAKLEGSSLTEASIIARLHPKFTQNLTITATGAAMLEATQTFIAPRKFYRLFFAGPVPILVIGAYSMDATLTGDARGVLSLSETIELSMPNTHFGMVYNPQTTLWEPKQGFKTSYKFEVSGKGDAGVELTLTLAPQLVLSFYDVATGSLILNPYVYANATINGEMTYNQFDGQDSFLADYWFSDMEAGAGIDLKSWAGFSIFDILIKTWPTDVKISEVDKYTKTPLIAKTPIAKLPELSAAFDMVEIHPEKSRAFRINGSFINVPNPFDDSGGSLLPFTSWLHPQWVTLDSEATMSPVDPTGRDITKGEEGALWLEYTGTGDYEIRMHGHSSLGWFIRQVAIETLTLTDNDGDEMVDQWESQHEVNDPDDDPEWDTLTNLQEFQGNTNPNTFKDDDEDGMPDLWELKHGIDESDGDPDNDSFSNLQEWQNRTDPNFPDLGNEAPPRILFSSNRDGNDEIYVMELDGTAQTNLTRNAARDDQQSASPDGTKIVFRSNRDGNNEIYVMDSDGGNPVNITNNTANDENPVWSPDGTQILFNTYRDGNSEVYLMGINGSNPKNLTNDPANDTDPKWSGDAQNFVFTSDRDGNLEAYSTYITGGSQTNLTDNSGDDLNPIWSPDSWSGNENSLISFISNRSGNSDIYLIRDEDSIPPINLSNNAAYDGDPAWSIDGDKIAFVSQRAGGDKIFVMNSDGTGTHLNLTDDSTSSLNPSWAPGNTKIAFERTDSNGFWDIYIMNANGSGIPQNLTNSTTGNDINASWIRSVNIVAGGLPDTGQHLCHNTLNGYGSAVTCTGSGQDGRYNINPMSFTDNGDGTIKDNVTALVWQKEGEDVFYNWYEASGTNDATYNPTGINVCGSVSLGGRNNWRLPTRKELMAIANYGAYYYDTVFNSTYFTPLLNENSTTIYFTSSDFPNGATWVVFLISGRVDIEGKTGRFGHVRCVSGASTPLSYTDNSDGTVTDNSTKLTWQQAMDTTQRTFQESIEYCENLSLSQHSDWRVPNVKELLTIVDETTVEPAIDTSVFFNTPEGQVAHTHWTSTTSYYSGGDPNGVRPVYFRFGQSKYDYSNTSLASVRCVR